MSNFQQHPISIITTFSSIRPSQTVLPNHNRNQFEDILEELKNNLKQFDALTDYSIKSFNLSDDETIKEIAENGRKSLIRNFLSPAFLEKFYAEMRKLSSAEILNFVTETIGTDSPKQRCQKAIEKMNNISRNSDNEEKFLAFHKRLTLTASEMTGAAQDVKTYFIEKVFRDNLTPSMKSFLLEQNSSDKSIEDISKLLDKCEKYRKNVNLFQIKTEASDEKIEQLSKMIQSLSNENANMMNFIKEKFTDMDHRNLQMDKEICKIKSEPKSNDTTKRPDFVKQASKEFSSNFTSKNHNFEQKTPNEYPANWELNAGGFPIRCTKCGYRGHRAQACRGTNATCNICRRQGHISPACPERSSQQNQYSKN